MTTLTREPGLKQVTQMRSIRTPLLLVLMLSILIPATLISLFGAYINIDTAYSRAYDQLTTVSALKSSQIQFWIELLRDEVNGLTNTPGFTLAVRQGVPDSPFPTLRDTAQQTILTNFRDVLRQSSQLENLYLLTQQGDVIVGTTPDVPTFTPITSTASIRRIYVNGPEIVDGTPRMAIWIPIFDEGRFLAFAGGSVNLDALYAILQDQTGSGETILTYLVNEEGVLINPDSAGTYTIGEASIPAPQTASSGVQRLDGFPSYHGEDVIGLSSSLGFDATLITEQQISEVLGPTFLTLFGSVALTIFEVFIVIIMGVYFIERRIVRPIRNLSETSLQVAQGDLDQRAQVTSNDELGVLASSFNIMTEQLQELISSLEQRIELRTRDLQLAADVSTKVTTQLDLDTLLPELVEQVRAAFNFYHVSVFVYNPNNQLMTLQAATGEAGRKMLEKGRSFRIGTDTGIVPLAATSNQYGLANDTLSSRDHAFNPFLPDTRAELALPMTVGDVLVGILDLQSKEVDRFQADDIRVLSTLAEQIGVAIRNAQLFVRVQEALTEAERANSVKSHFLASMSHELRTPLNAIINFTKFVLKEKMGPINEKQADALDKVKNSGIHLLNLINDVLDISKIESGTLHLIVEDDVDLNAIIDRAGSTAQALLENKPVQLVTEIQPELPRIIGDRQRILQILLNMVSNACKFTDEGAVTIRAYTRDENLYIDVEDTGPGIPEEDFKAVFESFRQTEAGLRQASGTGLGMPISRSLAEAHGGSLTLSSVVGEGSTFTLSLPVRSTVLVVDPI